MPESITPLRAFNRGLISPLALARTDLDRVSLSAETLENWMPRVLGSMMIRPGMQFIDSTLSDAAAILMDFVFSTDDVAGIEITATSIRVRVNDAVVTRASVSTAVTNGGFDSDLSSWTDQDDAGATSQWVASGYMGLSGTGLDGAAAKREQQVTVAAGDQNVEHALRIDVQRGEVILRVGSTTGDDDYVSQTTLAEGEHSIAFTPTGNFFCQLSGYTEYQSLVDSVSVEAAGDMTLTPPWAEADLDLLRWDQSADVIYIACEGYRPRRIERRGTTSWSLVLHKPKDGPFLSINTGPITLTPNALTGDVTLTASAPLFKSGHVGSLFKLTSSTQRVDDTLTTDPEFTEPIRVVGEGGQRDFGVIITGTWTGTLTLQYSVDEPGSWVDSDAAPYTSNVSTTVNDGLDNQVVYWRIGFKAGDYGSGSAVVTLSYSSGGSSGVCEVVSVTNSTSASVIVYDSLGGLDSTLLWKEGAWSSIQRFPSAVALWGGRLTWEGGDRFWGSVVDAYSSHDEDEEGDSAPLNKIIGVGKVGSGRWLVGAEWLLMGTDGTEMVIRSSIIDEPLTVSNFNAKDISGQGSARIAGKKIDNSAIFVQRSKTRVYEVAVPPGSGKYYSRDITIHIPEVGEPGIKRIAVQRQPDTRVHCVRTDGKVATLVYHYDEEVLCWLLTATDGVVEDVMVLPGEVEDQVYYLVKRTKDPNGSPTTVRYVEKWALESEARGGTVCKIADSFITYSGSAATTITGLDHLEGMTVVAWGDGQELSVSGPVSGGQVTVSPAAAEAMVGLPYNADFKSAKLAHTVNNATALTKRKNIHHLGLIMRDVHKAGVKYGRDFNTLYDLPAVQDGEVTSSTKVWDAFDKDQFEFPGSWDTDSRLCLRASAPRPVTVLAAIVDATVGG